MSKFSLDLFLQACGASGPLHLTVEYAGAAERYVLHQPFALVGSDPRADLRLSGGLIGRSSECGGRVRDGAVWRFHCALVKTPAGLWAVDLLGRGGIALNGVTARVGRLDEGDELRIGHFVFRPRRPRSSAELQVPSS